ncbi:MAG TPA: ABC transporter ATP-binding protein [Negativicutes bacterium]|nr:ABC transporter ATP-binding protein [Negativicutes bacterium]
MASETDQPLLRVENLKKYYSVSGGMFFRKGGLVKAVDGVSFAIYPGETLSLVGESGCGKSTIGKTIVKLEKPTAGNIFFQGQEVFSAQAHSGTDAQMIFQDPYSSLNPRKRIGDILREPIKAHGLLAGQAVNARVNELLEMVGISASYANRYPHEFSGGQRQRIGLARALSVNPRLIVCDEPVSALDVSIQAQILNLLKELQENLQLTYLFIAHGLGAVKYISNRTAVMYLGKIVEVAETRELFRQPQHPYTKALLDAYPIPNPKLRSVQRIVLEGEAQNESQPHSGCNFHARCPFATARCSEQEPLLIGEEHQVACFYPL